MGDGLKSIILLMYERLSNHCFKCGMVDHTTKECLKEEPIPIVNDIEKGHMVADMMKAINAMKCPDIDGQSGGMLKKFNLGQVGSSGTVDVDQMWSSGLG
ncbi:hypothetical protein QYF36_015449 [Acer negundo]|nr:hypothetical protein QYF36_015449 [Acer negundo]